MGDVLGSHCGSLDCHGHPARNMRIYAYNGLRIADVSGTGTTTDAEYDASYQSVIAIDPEALAFVVDEGGDRPERWIGRKPGTYEWIPFGGGIRRCLGASLAMAEQRVVLEEMSRRLDLEADDPEPEHAVHRNVTMIPSRGATVVIRARRD